MSLSQTQQLAIQAKLNMLLGRAAYDTLFLGVEFSQVSPDVLQVWVRSEYCATQIEARYLAAVVTAAERVLRAPIRYVNVSPRIIGGWTIR
jgi:hypothetical protein